MNNNRKQRIDKTSGCQGCQLAKQGLCDQSSCIL